MKMCFACVYLYLNLLPLELVGDNDNLIGRGRPTRLGQLSLFIHISTYQNIYTLQQQQLNLIGNFIVIFTIKLLKKLML